MSQSLAKKQCLSILKSLIKCEVGNGHIHIGTKKEQYFGWV